MVNHEDVGDEDKKRNRRRKRKITTGILKDSSSMRSNSSSSTSTSYLNHVNNMNHGHHNHYPPHHSVHNLNHNNHLNLHQNPNIVNAFNIISEQRKENEQQKSEKTSGGGGHHHLDLDHGLPSCVNNHNHSSNSHTLNRIETTVNDVTRGVPSKGSFFICIILLFIISFTLVYYFSPFITTHPTLPSIKSFNDFSSSSSSSSPTSASSSSASVPRSIHATSPSLSSLSNSIRITSNDPNLLNSRNHNRLDDLNNNASQHQPHEIPLESDHFHTSSTGTNSSNNDSNEESEVNKKIQMISMILPDDSVVVSTKSGKLLGYKIRELDRQISVFLGIPYAKPPVGNLRFKKPKAVIPWKGLRDATRFGHQCIQYKPSKTYTPWISTEDNMSEDCLTLNIWVPEGVFSTQKNSRSGNMKLKSVMVWFHGGAFFSGSTDVPYYDGRTLSSFGDVIIVTVNYRLAALGFFDAKTPDAPGNQGLYDQLLSLKWINENIKYFGGDPDSVTLFGQSAGAISVGLHYLSPMSQPYFKRGILESGAPTVSRLFYEKDSSEKTNKIPELARRVGCLASNARMEVFYEKSQEILSCLRKTDIKLIASVQNQLIDELSLAFGPTSGDEFLPDLPVNLLHEKISYGEETDDSDEDTDASDTSDDTEDDESGYHNHRHHGRNDRRFIHPKRISKRSPISSNIGKKHNVPIMSNFNKKEIMIGVNEDEGSFFLHFLDPKVFSSDPKNLSFLESMDFVNKSFNFLPEKFAKLITDMFLSWTENEESPVIRKALADFIGDATFTCPATLFANLLSTTKSTPSSSSSLRSGAGTTSSSSSPSPDDEMMRVYFYMFDHRPSLSPFPDWMGVLHFDEVPFAFGHPVRHPNLYTPEEVTFSKLIMRYWVTFAKEG